MVLKSGLPGSKCTLRLSLPLQVLQQYVSGRQARDLSQLLKVRGHILCSQQGDATAFGLRWSAVSPAVFVDVQPVRALPIIPTALLRSLTGLSSLAQSPRVASRQRGWVGSDASFLFIILVVFMSCSCSIFIYLVIYKNIQLSREEHLANEDVAKRVCTAPITQNYRNWLQYLGSCILYSILNRSDIGDIAVVSHQRPWCSVCVSWGVSLHHSVHTAEYNHTQLYTYLIYCSTINILFMWMCWVSNVLLAQSSFLWYNLNMRIRLCVFTSSFLTMDQTRKLLLLLESDPKASSLPLVGV